MMSMRTTAAWCCRRPAISNSSSATAALFSYFAQLDPELVASVLQRLQLQD
jgi:hypothetical protein